MGNMEEIKFKAAKLTVRLLPILCVGLLLNIATVKRSYSQITFQKTFSASAAGGGSPSITTGKAAVKQTTDDGFVIVGTTTLGVGSTDIILIKTTASGDTSWVKTYGGVADNEYGHDVIQSSDGGYVVVGKSYTFGPGWYDAYIIKTDINGNVTWSRAIGGMQNDLVRSVIETSDGGFVCVGESENFGSGGLDVYLIKLDVSGNLIWTNTYGDIGTEYGYAVRECSDNGFAIAAYTGSFGVDFWDMFLIKTDSIGTYQWAETFGKASGSSDERAFGLVHTSDNGYVMVGYSSNLGTGGSWDIYMVKTDFFGNMQWSKTYGGTGIDIGNDVQETSDGGLIVTGQGSFGLNNVIFKTDNSGNVIWANEYGSGFGHAYSVQQTTDSGCVALGRAGGNFYLVKTDSLGTTTCNTNAVTLTVGNAATVVSGGGNASTGGSEVIVVTLTTSPTISDSVYCSGGPACPAPVAGFSRSDTVLTVNFANTSSAGSYLWDFGDGDTSSVVSPSHTFATNGTYYVCLTVTDSCGTETLCDSVTVYYCPAGIAGFTSTDTILTATFTNTSTVGSYLWDFGDGNTDTSSSTTHTYAGNGTYDVCLTVTDSCGSDTYCDSVTVYFCPMPTSGFTASDSDLIATFTNTATLGTYLWDFGDGNFDTSANPTHTYSANGTYNVCLTLTDSCGSDIFCDSVTVYFCPGPVAGFSFTDSAQTAMFTNTSTLGTYLWNFDDGDTSSAASPSHTYAANGTYNVCVTTTDSCGSDTFCDSVLINYCPLPIANFTYTDSALTVNFTNTGTSGTEVWDFGDGSMDSVLNPTHIYAFDGTYVVCLTITDTCGSATYCDSITLLTTALIEHTAQELIIYPNPASKFLIVLNDVNKAVEIIVYDSQGKEVKIENVESRTTRINLNELAAGIYLVALYDERGGRLKKIFIKH